MLAGLPLLGAAWAGRNIAMYLEMPPLTSYVQHPPFSAAAFAGLAVGFVLVALPFVRRAFTTPAVDKPPRAVAPFPWWGWAGLGAGLVAWVAAWTRLDALATVQQHTFTPLWFAYIVVVNALVARRAGRCRLTHDTPRFLALFPVSAFFWWFFEYLNRFVQNWHYVGIDEFSAAEYTVFATLSFSTVLPAVMSTLDLLEAHRVGSPFRSWQIVRAGPRRMTGGLGLAFYGIALAAIAVRPDILFPLVWIAPAGVILSLQALAGRKTVLSDLAHGDWSRAVAACLAALVCGIFWEMWNMWSMAKWIYTVPYVQAIHMFEMPLLGFIGYLPFGIECLCIASLVTSFRIHDKESRPS